MPIIGVMSACIIPAVPRRSDGALVFERAGDSRYIVKSVQAV